MKAIIGTPPFFIQAMEEDGRTYIAGYTMDAVRAHQLFHVLSDALPRYRGYVEEAIRTQEETIADAYEVLHKYDRFFTGRALTYSVVSIGCYDDWPEFREKAL
jgi:hypothetical protein